MQRRLKKSVIYVLYGMAFCFMLIGLLFMEKSHDFSDNHQDDTYKQIEEENNYVSRIITDKINDIPVVADTKDIKINRPYNNDNIKIVKNYYNINDDEETQQNSLIYYGDTYLQSSGISYGLEESFDVLAILDGKVTEVKEDEILGNVVTIEHSNGFMSTYQSITDISVKEGDLVKQGDVIAKSSTSNISTDLGNHLYFELILNGSTVDPEDYFDKSLNEL